MRNYKGIVLVSSILALSLVVSGCLNFLRPEPPVVDELAWLDKVDWVYEEDFSTYAVGEFPATNWLSQVAERDVTWSIVEFEEAVNGYVLRASDAGFNPNRAILLHDLEQSKTGKLVLETRIWLDNAGLQGVDLWNVDHSWPNYASVHAWNLGKFASDDKLRAYDMVVLIELETQTVDVYINGTLFKEDIAFRAGHTLPDEGTYRIGLSFNAENDSTPVYWETLRVGLLD